MPGVIGGQQTGYEEIATARTALVRAPLRPPRDEGPVVTVNHYGTDVASAVVYGTTRGRLRAVDLRARRDAWTLAVPPELGLLTAAALGTDKSWVCAGTASGYVCLWDARFGGGRRRLLFFLKPSRERRRASEPSAF